MRHRLKGRQFGRNTSHRKALFRSLVTSLIQHEKIETTLAKAKELRGIADRMITLGKRGDLHSKRLALSYIRSRDVVTKLFDDIAKRSANRPGGFTRIVPTRVRYGDSAEMAVIELVDAPGEVYKGPASKTKKKAAPKKKAEKVEKAAEAEAVTETAEEAAEAPAEETAEAPAEEAAAETEETKAEAAPEEAPAEAPAEEAKAEEAPAEVEKKEEEAAIQYMRYAKAPAVTAGAFFMSWFTSHSRRVFVAEIPTPPCCRGGSRAAS